MIDRELQDIAEVSRKLAMAQLDKAADESMASLIAWLLEAGNKNLLTFEKAQEIFSAELKERFGYDS